MGGFFLRAFLAHRQGDDDASAELLAAAGAARGPEWKPEGTVAEGDVRQQMHIETSPLAGFWQGWDGGTEPDLAFRSLESFLAELPVGR